MKRLWLTSFVLLYPVLSNADVFSSTPSMFPDGSHWVVTGPPMAVALEDLDRDLWPDASNFSKLTACHEAAHVVQQRGGLNINGKSASAVGELDYGFDVEFRGSKGKTDVYSFGCTSFDLLLSGGGNQYSVKTRPGRPVFGNFSITDSGIVGPDRYQISNFFDIFVDISLDGGQSWTENQEMRFDLKASPVPEPASLSFLALAGLALLKRRKSH